MTLEGRVALITGAGQGLGAAIARHFLAHGAAVSLCARSRRDLEAQHAQLAALYPVERIHVRTADVASQGEVDALFDATLATFGRLDILVNNAGVYGPMGSIDTIDWAEWVEALRINVVGTAYCARRAIGIFKPRRYGKIINLSGGGATKPLVGLSAYAAAKAAVVRLTETLALEVRDWGIDVNAVAPGALATRLTDQVIAAGPERVGKALHAQMLKVKAEGGTALGCGAELCVYLASGHSDGVTGRLLAALWDPWPFDDAVRHELAGSDVYTLRRIEARDRQKFWGQGGCG
jgi:NAD(P)-dependent dehydrogenase (short-subunit alcohol dehydrogenase family)